MMASRKTAILLVILNYFVSVVPAGAQSVFSEAPETPGSKALLARSANLSEIKADKAARHVSVVRVDGALLRKARGRRVELDVGSSLKLAARTKSIQELDGGRFIWRGEIVSDRKGGRVKASPGGTATIVINGDNATGTIDAPDGRLFRLQPIGGGQNALVEIDVSALPPADGPDEMPLPAARPKSATAPPRRRAADGPPIIDVIVAYTTNAKTWSGDIDSLIALAIADTNQSFVNSGISASLRLVHTVEYAYDDERPSRHTLSDFAGNGDGKMDTIHALREEYGGDVAVLIHGGYSGGYATLAATADTAFAVVEWRRIAGRYLFAHEIGHVAGALHQEGTGGCQVPLGHPFTFARGFQYLSGARGWSTIMGDQCSGVPASKRHILYWSNPSRCFEGIRMGIPGRADNARLWNERAPVLAAFKTPPTAKPQPAPTAGPSLK